MNWDQLNPFIEPEYYNDSDNNIDHGDYPLNLLLTLRSAKYTIIKKTIQYLGLFYLVMGVSISYGWCCVTMDVKSIENKHTDVFWAPLAGIFSFMNTCVFLLVTCHHYYRKRFNLSNKKPLNNNNKYTTFSILIPLYLTTLVFLIVFNIRDVMMGQCTGYATFSLFISVILLTTSTLFLIYNMCFKTTPNDNVYMLFKSEAIDLVIIFFTIIGIINVLIFNVFIQQIVIYITESKNSSYGYHFQLNNTCVKNGTIGYQLDQIIHKYGIYFRPILILFCICLISYLFQPLMKKIKYLIETEKKSLKQNIIVKFSEEQVINKVIDQNPSFRLPSLSLVICLTLLSLSFLAVLIMINFSGKRKVNLNSRLIFLILNLLIYLTGIPLTLNYIKGVTKWPPFQNHNGKFTDYCIIWIGACGQIIKTILMFSFAIDSIYFYNQINLNVLIIITSLLANFQVYFQTVLLNFILETKWQKPEKNTWLESLCPAVGMLGLNVGLIVICIYENDLTTDNKHKIFMDLFLNGMSIFGTILVILQRLHAVLVFANIIIHTHN